MAKQTEFAHPPQGHIAPLVYDSVAKKWYAIKGSGYDYLQVDVQSSDLPDGAAIESKQLPDGHNVTVDNMSLAVTGTFYQVTQPVSASSLPLPSGAAIESKQTIQITALQSIQNLVGALANVAVDELRVNLIEELPAGTQNIGDVDVATMPTTTVQATGSDKIFSFESVVANKVDTVISGAEGYVESGAVPADKIWVITSVVSRDLNSATTAHEFRLLHDNVEYDFYSVVRAIAANTRVSWTGTIYLDASDRVRIWFVGALATDNVRVRICGYQMDAP